VRYEIITQPTQTPVSLDEAKAHLRVDHPDDDAAIINMIKSATSMAEEFLRRALCTQTIKLAMPTFPSGSIVLPRPPIQSIVAVSYYTEDDLLASILNLPPAAIYTLDEYEYAAVLLPGKSWPATATHRTAAFVEYIAGYASPALVPEPIRQAILMTVGHFFANREDVITGTIAAALPRSAESLLWPFRHFAIV
jgi:uncharacterized phiE125 gp8 family phage protein